MKTNKLSIACMVMLFSFSMTVFAQKANVKTVIFSSNMHCMSCQQKIEKNIAYEKGVKDLAVDLKLNTIKITFDARKTSEEKLAEAINKLGYEAKLSTTETKGSAKVESACTKKMEESCADKKADVSPKK